MANFNALKTQAEYLLAKMEHGKGYRIGDLNQRLRLAADENPGDIVIRSVASVIERLHIKDPNSMMTQGQLEGVYQELVGLNTNTRFREVLGDLLRSEKNEAELTNKDFVGAMRDPVEGFLNYDVDEKVKEGFDNIFGSATNSYDPQNATKAKEKVELELRSMGFNPHVRLAGGNSRFLIFATSLDTNRGSVPLYIPAESSGDKLPSVFVGSNTFEQLTTSNLSDYLSAAAYNRDRLPEVSNILNALDQALGVAPKTTEQDEFVKLFANLPESNGSEGLSAPGTFAELPEQNSLRNIEIPSTPVPTELKALTSEIEENVLEAAVGYPQASVRLAKRIIIAELGSMGFKNSQVRVASPTNDGFICEAILNTPNGKLKIEVPIEMNGNAPLLPSVFAKNDYVADFNAVNIQALAMKEAGYVDGAVRADTQLYGMSLHELRDAMSKSATKGDLNTCDEIIEVISDRFDEDTYRSIVGDYHKILSKLGTAKDALRQAYEDSDQFIRTPNSMYPVHKKLGLPAHELIRDENGVWHRKSTYAAKQDQEHLNTFFSTAKVLVGD
jgi:hypothetical protein